MPLLEGAPELDGQVDDAFWLEACRVQGFTRFTTDGVLSPMIRGKSFVPLRIE